MSFVSTTLMDAFHARYHEIIECDIDIIRAMSSHLDSGEGKQLRPTLTFLSALCCGFQDNDTSRHKLCSVAAAMEMLHNSSLIHDDVIDESDSRRGIPTVNSLWNNKKAVLYGDYLLAMVMRTIHEVDIPRITAIVTDTSTTMSCGELDTPISTCLKVIEMKTACFLSACCEVGAILATADEERIMQARLFGMSLGMAFQLRDDLRDFLPSRMTGKPQGNDLREHKATLPIILALESIGEKASKEKLLALLSQQVMTDDDISLITDMVSGCPGWQQAKQFLNDYIAKAENHLLMLPANNHREAMGKLLHYLKEN